MSDHALLTGTTDWPVQGVDGWLAGLGALCPEVLEILTPGVTAEIVTDTGRRLRATWRAEQTRQFTAWWPDRRGDDEIDDAIGAKNVVVWRPVRQ